MICNFCDEPEGKIHWLKGYKFCDKCAKEKQKLQSLLFVNVKRIKKEGSELFNEKSRIYDINLIVQLIYKFHIEETRQAKEFLELIR